MDATHEDDRESYAALADEMNDPDAPAWKDEDWDADYVAGAKRYAAREGLRFPPRLGDFDRFYEREQETARRGS